MQFNSFIYFVCKWTVFKFLRKIYEFVIEYGPKINIEYEGRFEKLGDTVMIRPYPKLFDNPAMYRTLVVDTIMPEFNQLQYLMNKVDWMSEGDLVICLVSGKFLMGYNRV